MTKSSNIFLFFILLLSAFAAQGQEVKKKVTIRHADTVKRTIAVVKDAQRLLGNVDFLYEESELFCDSAYYYDSKDFEAWGHIIINQGDSLFLYGDYLFLDYEDGIANMEDNLRLVDDDMTLTTDRLNFDMSESVASFFDGGKIVSKKDDNILTSDQGYYSANDKRFFFKKDVELKNPEYQLHSDTLQYDSETDIAYFFGATTIEGNTANIYCENGWYNTQTDICQFNENARIDSGDKTLLGDSVYYDGAKKYGEVLGNVQISDTTGNFFITGDYGHHFEEANKSLVTGRALLTQVFDTDSMFLKADTLLALNDSLSNDLLLGFHNVRIFKNDMQGTCDSLSFMDSDSTLTLYSDPILWSDRNQISGDTIVIRLYEGTIERFDIPRNGIIVSEAATDRYNQIQGRVLQGIFKENELRKVLALGNGEAIYYPVEKEGNVTKVMGLNRIYCSDIDIRIDSNDIKQINFLDKPSGRMLVPAEITDEDRKLSAFQWRIDERPLSREDLFVDRKSLD